MSNKQLKIIVIGNPAVGKTSIRKRYFGAGFSTSHLATIGADFAVKSLIINDLTVHAQIWDLAGQGGFANIRKRFYQGADCVIVVYDVTDPTSFQALASWLKELWENTGTRHIPILLIGNKVDLVDNDTSTTQKEQEYLNYLRTHTSLQGVPIHFIKTSAKDGTNINNAFSLIIEATLNYKRTDIS